jgi:hypothetical protein
MHLVVNVGVASEPLIYANQDISLTSLRPDSTPYRFQIALTCTLLMVNFMLLHVQVVFRVCSSLAAPDTWHRRPTSRSKVKTILCYGGRIWKGLDLATMRSLAWQILSSSSNSKPKETKHDDDVFNDTPALINHLGGFDIDISSCNNDIDPLICQDDSRQGFTLCLERPYIYFNDIHGMCYWRI